MKAKSTKYNWTRLSPTLTMSKGVNGKFQLRSNTYSTHTLYVKPEYIKDLCIYLVENFKDELADMPEYVKETLKL